MEKSIRTTGAISIRHRTRLKIVIVALFLALITLYHIFKLNDIFHKDDVRIIMDVMPTPMPIQINRSYLLMSTTCLIPDIDPHEDNMQVLFTKKTYQSCTIQPLTMLDDGVLTVNSTARDILVAEGSRVKCCYSVVRNHNESKHFDIKISSTDCKEFTEPVSLTSDEEFIITRCEVFDKLNKKTNYKNAHVNIKITDAIRRRIDSQSFDSSFKPWNVLIFGIDTLSRLNLARAMPKTNGFLKENNWLDFQAYNKIDENTYPNVMAILTGRNQTIARQICDGKGANSPDNCDFMWKRYEKAGYVTAYGEDWVGIDTFGKPLHTGFTRRPTDHYLRPIFKAAETRVNNKHLDKHFCTGQTTSAEFLYDYAVKFTKAYKDYPHFGFFWSNTFSHDDLSTPSCMDEKIKGFLDQLQTSGALNTTIVLFISDHGLRFGKPRFELTGYYEERLPAFFVSLPPKFIADNPDAYGDMLANTKRLTNPYDVYMTLEDILVISKRRRHLISSHACPNCDSLFKPVMWNRSCEDCAIAPHWCTCNPLRTLPNDHNDAVRAAKHVVDVEIERILSTVNSKLCRICARLRLKKVLHLYSYDYLASLNDTYVDYLVAFSTYPGDMAFESTVRHYTDYDRFVALGKISRLTFYADTGGCVDSDNMKNYCFCNDVCRPDVGTESVQTYLIVIPIVLFISVIFACIIYNNGQNHNRYAPLRNLK